MADGKTHTRVTVFHGTYFSLTLLMLGFYNVQWFALGFFYQIFASPDRDLEGSIGEYYLRKYTGFLHIYWQHVWYPYAVSMKHRGKSHAVYGTIVRLIYLVSPFSVLLFHDSPDRCSTADLIVSQIMCFPLLTLLFLMLFHFGVGAFALFVLGIFVSDTLHILFDGIRVGL